MNTLSAFSKHRRFPDDSSTGSLDLPVNKGFLPSLGDQGGVNELHIPYAPS